MNVTFWGTVSPQYVTFVFWQLINFGEKLFSTQVSASNPEFENGFEVPRALPALTFYFSMIEVGGRVTTLREYDI